jgi:hypothetical protein
MLNVVMLAMLRNILRVWKTLSRNITFHDKPYHIF